MPIPLWCSLRIRAYWAVYAAATVLVSIGYKTPAQGVFAFKPEKLAAIDAAIENAIRDARMPGAVFWLEHNGTIYRKAFGHRSVKPGLEAMTEDTIFDAASLTKVIATTPVIMRLVERGIIDVDAPVQRYVEEFRRDGKEQITIRHLLTHTSGLRAGLSTKPDGPRSAIEIACQEKITHEPGTFFRYSDINFILLGEIIERVGRRSLQDIVADEVLVPLKMTDTQYQPSRRYGKRIAPTESDGTNMLRGVVHDPTARRMGGVAGHAGLFTTAEDLARFARMLLNYGQGASARILQLNTVVSMTSIQSPAQIQEKRGFGWDIQSPFSRPRGTFFPLGSYGHTGFTGTSVWMDPHSKTFWILLTNRLHPDGRGNILALQASLASLAGEAVGLQSHTGATEP